MYMYDICMSVWRGCLYRILDVNSTGIIVTKQGMSDGVYVFTEAKAGYFIKQYQDLLDLQKVKFVDKPATFTHLLHNCDIRSRTTIEKQFSIGILLIPPCITAIENYHKQEEDV